MTQDKDQQEIQADIDMDAIELDLTGAKVDLKQMDTDLRGYERMIRRCDHRIAAYQRKLQALQLQQDKQDKTLMDKALDLFKLKSRVSFRS